MAAGDGSPAEGDRVRDELLRNPRYAIPAPAKPNPDWKIKQECKQFSEDPKRYNECASTTNPAVLLMPGARLERQDGKVRVDVPSRKIEVESND